MAYLRGCGRLESHRIVKKCDLIYHVFPHPSPLMEGERSSRWGSMMHMRTLPKYLTQDELKRFFAAIDSPRDRALFGLIYHYGLRVGEALMLTLDDVNFKNHRLTIRRLKNGLGGEKPLYRDSGTDARCRRGRKSWAIGP